MDETEVNFGTSPSAKSSMSWDTVFIAMVRGFKAPSVACTRP